VVSADDPVLVVGADSLVGSALRQRFLQDHLHCLSTSRRREAEFRLDLNAAPEEWELPDRFSVAFLCAARTNIIECERSPAETRFINVTRTVELARRLRDRGSFVIFLSTNLVFDGSRPFPKVDDTPTPTTAYGRQKVEAEEALRRWAKSLAIVRFTKVVHPAMPLIIEWAASLRRGEPIQPYREKVFSPIPLTSVVNALQLIAKRREPGIVHISAERDITYYTLAHSLARHLHAPLDLIQPCYAPADSPPFATLQMREEDTYLMTPPAAMETIRELVSIF
jgi:dTDP-4-dehydrorhamnose reductase